MNIYSFLVFAFFSFVSWVLIRNLAPYSELSKLKFTTLKSDFLAKLLIPKQSGYVRVGERKKISIISLVFYVMFVLRMAVIVAMLILPGIPCEPYTGRFGRRGQVNWTIYTWNEKIITLLPIIFLLIELLILVIRVLPIIIKNKTESRKTVAGFIFAIVAIVGLLAFFIFELLG